MEVNSLVTPFDAVAGIAVSVVTAIVGQFGQLSGAWRQLIAIVLSAAVAVLMAGSQFTLQNYLSALVAVFAAANAAQAVGKYGLRAVTPSDGGAQDAPKPGLGHG